MGRIRTTLFAVVAIAVVLFIMFQGQSIGAPWILTVFGIILIVIIVIRVIRDWLSL